MYIANLLEYTKMLNAIEQIPVATDATWRKTASLKDLCIYTIFNIIQIYEIGTQYINHSIEIWQRTRAVTRDYKVR